MGRIAQRLQALTLARRPDDLNLPGYFFHALKGDMKGRYAIRVSGNWRITFGWDDSGPAAVDVDYEDYH